MKRKADCVGSCEVLETEEINAPKKQKTSALFQIVSAGVDSELVAEEHPNVYERANKSNAYLYHQALQHNNFIADSKLRELLSKNLIQISSHDFVADLETEKIPDVTPQFQLAIHYNIHLLKNTVDVDAITEQSLQSFTKFLIDFAACGYSNYTLPTQFPLNQPTKNDGWFQIAGGGQLTISEIIDICTKLSIDPKSIHYNFDFKLKWDDQFNRKIVPEFQLYFGVYQLNSALLVGNVDIQLLMKHKDFIKITATLKAMIRAYAIELKMNRRDFETIHVWGVLQSNNMLWCLRCSVVTNDVIESNEYSAMYTIECSPKPFIIDDINDAFLISRIFSLMLKDAKALQDLLVKFKPNSANTQAAITKSSSRYQIVAQVKTFADFILDEIQNKFASFTRVHDEDQQQFISSIESDTSWKFKYVQKFDNYSATRTVVNNFTEETYLLRNPKKLCRINSFETSNVNIIFISGVHNESTLRAEQLQFNTATFSKPITAPAVVEEVRDHRNNNPDRHCQLKPQNGTSILPSNQHNLQSSSFSNSSSKQQQDSIENKHLQLAVQQYVGSLHFHKEMVHDDAVYLTVYNKDTISHVKIARSLLATEASSIMNDLLSKKLSHTNIVKIERYEIMHVLNEREAIIATQSELLSHTVRIFPQFYTVKGIHKLLLWLWKDVVMASIEGLLYLHNNQILHGDISVGNILFRTTDCSYTAVLIDLNNSILFSMLDNRDAMLRRYYGKPGYFPPREFLPSIFTDCYGLIITICDIIHLILFGKFAHTNYVDYMLHEELQCIFDIKNWSNNVQLEQHVQLKQFLFHLQYAFHKIVVMQERDATVSFLKQHFGKLEYLFVEKKQ